MTAHDTVRDYLRSVADKLDADVYSFLVDTRATNYLLNENEPGLTISSTALAPLVRASKSSRLSYDVATLLVALLTGVGEPLPEELWDFMHDVLRENRKRPVKDGQWRYKNLARDEIVQDAVLKAIGANPGLLPYRNDVSEKKSACDVVAACLPEIGINDLGYEGVKKLYKRRVKWCKELEAWSSQPAD